MNIDHIAAVAEVVSEALLTERDRTDGRIAKAAEQITLAEQSFLSAINDAQVKFAAGDAELLVTIEESHRQLRGAADAAILLVKGQVLDVEKGLAAAIEAATTEVETGPIAELQEKLKLFEAATSEDLKQLHALKGLFDDFVEQAISARAAAAAHLAGIVESNDCLSGIVEARFSDSKEFAEKVIGERIELVRVEVSAEFKNLADLAVAAVAKSKQTEQETHAARLAIFDKIAELEAEAAKTSDKLLDDIRKQSLDFANSLSLAAESSEAALAAKAVQLSDSAAYAIVKATEVEQKTATDIANVLEYVAKSKDEAVALFDRLAAEIDAKALAFANALSSWSGTSELSMLAAKAEFEEAHTAALAEIAQLHSDVNFQSSRLDHIQLQKGDAGRDGLGLDVPIWKPGIYRKDAVVQHDVGRCSIALQDTSEQPSRDSADWERIGTGGMKMTGIKVDGRFYEEGDIFIDDGTSFIFSGGKAKMFAQRGRKGDKGDAVKGDAGDKGASVIDAAVVGDSLNFVNSDGETFAVPLKAFEPIIRQYAREVAMELLTQAGIAE